MKRTINAQVVADSISDLNLGITTFLLTYPRFIHAELMTHRMFSRNSASSRAIPLEKMIKMVQEDSFIPIAWPRDFLYICRKIKLCISTKQQICSTVKFT